MSVDAFVGIRLGGLAIIAVNNYFVLLQVAKGKKWARLLCLLNGEAALR